MIDVVVTRKRREAEGIYSFELAPAEGSMLPAFSAGSHIDVHLPNSLVRQYSLCNHPEERHRYLLGVLLDPASRGGSQAMHEQVHEGSRLRISEPRNLFPLAHAAGYSVLFAGGIGITPILCMAERLARIGAPFELHYCGRSAGRMAFVEYIRRSAFADCVHVHVDDGEDDQRLDSARVLSAPTSDRHLYVCGPNGFMEHVLSTARTQGWAEAQLHREYFAGAAVPASEAGGFDVQLASSGRCLQVPAHRSVAQVLLEAGIDIPLSCEQGICGTCITRVLEGEPEHRDMFLTDASGPATTSSRRVARVPGVRGWCLISEVFMNPSLFAAAFRQLIEDSNMQQLPGFKRVVTGHDAQGRAVVALCGPTPNSFPLKAVPGTVFHEIWNSDASPAVLDNGDDPTRKPLQLSPAPLGSVIRVVDIPPDSVQNQVSAEDAAAAFAEIGQAHAGTGQADSKHKLMHRTETLDYGVVTEGEVWLVLDGEEVHLKRGDIVVQRGTNHAWSNRTEQMARMLFVLLDGRFAPELQGEQA